MGAPVQAKDAMITCVTCGLTYSVSQGRDSCVRCPLHEDCSTSCCPKCGTSNINPDKSRLARWLERILTPRLAQGTEESVAETDEASRGEDSSDLSGGLRHRKQMRRRQGHHLYTLADVQPGREVQITGYGELNSSQRQHLQAYGLLPGRRVRALSQHPVTIVQVEQTELAFERGIAARVLVGD